MGMVAVCSQWRQFATDVLGGFEVSDEKARVNNTQSSSPIDDSCFHKALVRRKKEGRRLCEFMTLTIYSQAPPADRYRRAGHKYFHCGEPRPAVKRLVIMQMPLIGQLSPLLQTSLKVLSIFILYMQAPACYGKRTICTKGLMGHKLAGLRTHCKLAQRQACALIISLSSLRSSGSV